MSRTDSTGLPLLEEGDQLELPPRSEVRIRSDATYEDEYNTLEKLGQGKYGIVRKFERKSDKLHVAAKFIKKSSSSREDVEREISTLSQLHHKRIIAVFDAYELRRELVVVMELVTGGELFEKVVQDDILTEKQVIRYTRQILFAVQHMHRKCVVHLDLKPENILYIAGGVPGYEEIKLIDFGTARILNEGEKVRAMCGTPEFIAPEIINFDPITLAADMWSMGVIVYVLLTGLSPFMGDNDSETLANVTSGEFDFEDDFDDEDEEEEGEGIFANISDQVKQFITDLLIKKPNKRLTVDECFSHPWLIAEGKDKKIKVQKLKEFLARRRWQKTTNTIRAVSRMCGGLTLPLREKESSHGQKPGTFLEQVKKQIQKEGGDEPVQSNETTNPVDDSVFQG